MVTSLTDREAFVRSLDEPELFLVVFERHYEAISRYLARRLPSDTAADLSSEVFTQAFAGRARFDGGVGEPVAFLYGIAANLIRRQRRQEERMLRAYARAGVEGPAPDPNIEDSAAIAAALLDLRPEEREVLLLHTWADLDYEQIAAALRVPVGTVRSRLHRGRARLRTSLATPTTTEEALDG